MNNIKQALKSKTVLKALALGLASILVAIFTELDMIAYVGIVNMVVDIFLRSTTTVSLTDK